jgi:YrbI family 3-deoxy-D-manno-octulosonate 8-phosphate phosphatase
MSQPEVLAILPARGGSKGIPRKNIRPFAGYPLIAFSIAAARQAETVTRVIVSTDDAEIAEVARQHGAETPFMRPAELAADRTMDLPVFQHALAWLEEHEPYRPEIVLHLHPTSPVRPRGALDRAVRQMLDHPEADCTRSVVEPLQSPFKMWRIDEKTGRMVPLVSLPGVKEPYNTPRQLLPFTYLQTGHVNAIRSAVIRAGSMTGEVILPLIIDGRFEVDLDTLADWEHGEWVVAQGKLDMVWPGTPSRSMPARIRLLVMDFDGVVTDNRVWVDQDGREMVAANRSDSLGLSRLRQAGVEAAVISMETNPVVAARCRKMNVPWIQGENDKAAALKKLLQERGIAASETVFLGNDVNDLPCFPLVGWAVAVSDAMPEVARQADYVLSRKGGHAAVRELCDLILARKKE